MLRRQNDPPRDLPRARLQATSRGSVGAGYGKKHGMTVPVCMHHFKSRLWWYRGWIFCRDEEAE